MREGIKDLIKAFCGVAWTAAIVGLVSEAWPGKGTMDRVSYVVLGLFLIMLAWDFAVNRLFGKGS